MPERQLVAKEIAGLLGVLSHPARVRIVEELREGELDVKTLQERLGISHTGVSQHLSLLRARRLLVERREGRHVFYRLRQPELATWLLDGLRFLEAGQEEMERFHEAAEKVRSLWGTSS